MGATDGSGTGQTRRELFRRAGAGSVLLLGGAVLSACSRGDEAAGPADQPRAERPVEDFGATGDGTSDDTEALQRALSQVRTGEALVFAEGRTYLHSDVLVLTVPGVLLRGGGQLLATDEERSSLQVDAANVTVEDLMLGVRETTRRWDAPAQHRLFASTQASGLRLRRVEVTASAASGLFLAGVQGFEIDDCRVSDTRADGIHLTLGSREGVVRRPQLNGTGDDGVAVVSYLEDGVVCRSIEVLAPVVRTTVGGRGVSVVGGEDITYRDVDIDGTRAAGVYVACEGDPFFTYSSTRVQVLGGRITGANTDAAIDHGSVLVYAGRDGGRVSEVLIVGLEISGSRTGASAQVGVLTDAGSTSDITIKDLALDTADAAFRATDEPCCALSGWTVEDRPLDLPA